MRRFGRPLIPPMHPLDLEYRYGSGHDGPERLVGNDKAAGREWEPAGSPRPVKVHDFAGPVLGKVAPYGVYDIAANTGWINVGIDADTGAFAVESIRR